jgi:hypothetical protein
LSSLIILVIWCQENFQDLEEIRHIEYVSDSDSE